MGRVAGDGSPSIQKPGQHGRRDTCESIETQRTPPDSGWGGGFMVGYHIIDWLSIEFDYTYAKVDFRGWDCSVFGSCLTGFPRKYEASSNASLFNVVFNIPAGEIVVPYVKIGVGGFFTDAPVFEQSGALIGLGLGSRIFPIPDSGFNLRFEGDLAAAIPVDTIGGVFIDNTTGTVRVTMGVGWVFNFSN
jgi:hypothetical protein